MAATCVYYSMRTQRCSALIAQQQQTLARAHLEQAKIAARPSGFRHSIPTPICYASFSSSNAYSIVPAQSFSFVSCLLLARLRQQPVCSEFSSPVVKKAKNPTLTDAVRGVLAAQSSYSIHPSGSRIGSAVRFLLTSHILSFALLRVIVPSILLLPGIPI